MNRRRWRFIGLVAWLFALTGGAFAQTLPDTPTPQKTLKVGVFIDAPFVMPAKEGYTGIAAELWQVVAKDNGLPFDYVSFPTISGLLQAAALGEVDVAVSALSVTQDRLRRMDFTQPWYDSGLRIMIEQDRGQGLGALIAGLEQSGHLKVYLWIALIIAFATLVLTLVDRYFDKDFPSKWHEGLAESFYHVMSVATSGKASHKPMFGVPGKVLATLWMVCGIAIVAYVTSSITSVMTTTALNNQINSFADLPGKTAGVLKGSVGETYCLQQGIETIAYDNILQAVDGLLRRQVDAIVNDAPVLEYYDKTHPELPITEVGGLFHTEKLGFALPFASPLTRPLSLGIVSAREAGVIERLKMKYLGNM